MSIEMLHSESVKEAALRIADHISPTPLLHSTLLNEAMGNQIIFKCEGFQKTGSFKARGAFNALLALKEQYRNSSFSVCAFSSGNHSQALALAARGAGVPATIYIPQAASPIKIRATQHYGAKVVITKDRPEAERLVADNQDPNCAIVHPFDNNYVLSGQGTACMEALQHVSADAIFAPCGGGGLLSGSLLARDFMRSKAKMFGVEPSMASDAQASFRQGEVVGLNGTPNTIADGVRTPRIADRTFQYIRKLDDMFDVSETEIVYWSQWLSHLLKISVEPTSAVAMAGAHRWILETGQRGKTILILLSGGNIDVDTHKLIWQESFLDQMPSLEGARSQVVGNQLLMA
jgi:threonine dehydratase